MRAPQWLTARPIAHRGLHDAARGVIENTPSAVAAAIAHDFAIEVDLQLSADGEAMVYHDDALGRLTEGDLPLREVTAADLKRTVFRATSDRMMTLHDLCDLVGGSVAMVLEVKSHFDNDLNLIRRIADVLKSYSGPAAIMSFDPAPVIALREIARHIPRGIVAQRRYTDGEWTALPPSTRAGMTHLRHALHSRPHFVAYWVRDLPAAAPLIARHLFGCPLLTWTVRTADDRTRAARWADQIIFEGFLPDA